MNTAYLFLLMLLCHILDDFVLQPICLSKLKQKKFWEEHAPEKMYRLDYIAALMIHGLSWALIVTLPMAYHLNFCVEGGFYLLVFIHAFIHAFIDNAKANWKVCNLIQDQMLHFAQIVSIFIILI